MKTETTTTCYLDWELPLPNFTGPRTNRYDNYYIQLVGEEAILRFFHGVDLTSINGTDVTYISDSNLEYLRIVFGQSKNSAYRYKGGKGWYEIDVSHDKWSINDFIAVSIGIDEGVYETNLKFYQSYMDDNISKLILAAVYPAVDNLLKLPNGRQLYKSIYNQFYRTGASLSEVILNSFGEFNPNAKSFAKMVGLKQFMLDAVLNLSSLDMDVFIEDGRFMKSRKFIGEEYLKCMEKNVFLKVLYYTVNAFNDWTFENLIEDFGADNISGYLNKLDTFFNKESSSVYEMYMEYIFMCRSVGKDKYPKYQWNLTVEELVRHHDEVSIIYNMEMNKEEFKEIEEEFYKQQEIWKQYAYTEDKLSVVYPQTPFEIALEGINLHHCAKDYVKAVSSGETILLFIRKNEELNKSYFTLEIRDGKVRQCHGFANCEINNEIEDFLWNFCHNKGVNYNFKNDCLAV